MSTGTGSLQDDDIIGALSAKILARGMMELEVRLKQEITENLLFGNQKIVAELTKMEKNFGRVFNVMESHDKLLQELQGKVVQVNSRISNLEKCIKEYVFKEKDLGGPSPPIGKRDIGFSSNINSKCASHSLHTGSGTSSYRNYLDAAPNSNRGGFSFRSSKEVPPRYTPRNNHNEGYGGNVRGRPPKNQSSFKSSPPKFVQMDKITQIQSSAQWTRRGSGVFTSEEESETEQVTKTELVVASKTVNNAESVGQQDSSISLDGGISSRQSISTPATLTTTTNNNNNAANGLTGGFGNFRRGKPPVTSAAPIQIPPPASFQQPQKKVHASIPAPESSDVVCRPLTSDELRVILMSSGGNGNVREAVDLNN